MFPNVTYNLAPTVSSKNTSSW